MITSSRGDLLESGAEALVNAVNTVGVMGKGIALAFKRRFPANFLAYRDACKRGEVRVGLMFVTETGEPDGPRLIINFPTKRHWRDPSRMEWIDGGLEDLKRIVIEKRIRSIAIPALGSGNGGLTWRDVKPKIEAVFARSPDVMVIIHEPI